MATSEEWENAYQNDPGSVYKLLTKSLDRQKDQDIPHLSQDEQSIEQQKEHTCYENVDEVDLYWRGLWETEAKENLYADWFKEVEDGVGQTGGGGHTKS